MAIQYFSADKESRVRAAEKGLRPADSVEIKAIGLCRAEEKKGEELILCAYQKLGGAWGGSLEEKADETTETTDEEKPAEEPKKRGPKPKAK